MGNYVFILGKGANNTTNSVNQSQLSNQMPEISNQFPQKLQPSQFQRHRTVSNIFTLVLKGDVNLRKGKIALLPSRQGIDPSHIWSRFTQIKHKNEYLFKKYKYQRHYYLKSNPSVLPSHRTSGRIQLFPLDLILATIVTVCPFLYASSIVNLLLPVRANGF